MVREELVAALKNAIDGGESLEKALRSLISAGYDSKEVQEASKYVDTSILHNLPTDNQPDQEEIYNPEPNKESNNLEVTESGYKKLPTIGVAPTTSTNKDQTQGQKKKMSKALLIPIIILVVLILGLGFFMIFGEKILSALFK